MSVAPPPPSQGSGAPGNPPAPSQPPLMEACPLCRAPLHPEQEWCLSCGAAARTRLAASPAWKTPVVALVVVLVLSLGVLAGSLIKLAGGSPTAPTQTTTITTTTPAASTATTTPTTLTTPSTAAPNTGTAAPGALPGTGANGTRTPGSSSAKNSLPTETQGVKAKSPGAKEPSLAEKISKKLQLLKHSKQ